MKGGWEGGRISVGRRETERQWWLWHKSEPTSEREACGVAVEGHRLTGRSPIANGCLVTCDGRGHTMFRVWSVLYNNMETYRTDQPNVALNLNGMNMTWPKLKLMIVWWACTSTHERPKDRATLTSSAYVSILYRLSANHVSKWLNCARHRGIQWRVKISPSAGDVVIILHNRSIIIIIAITITTMYTYQC